MNKKVTIQDIADALGISRNTVSKAINNSEGLADATRERILQKAVEMGYKQFSYATSIGGISPLTMDNAGMVTGYQGEIALLTTTFLTGSHFASLMLDKFQRELSQLGYTLNTHRVTEQNLRNKTLPFTFLREQAKAIMCIEVFDWEYSEMICGLDLPVLFVDGPAQTKGKTLPADKLYMENMNAVTSFMHNMFDQGITRIGFIGKPDHCQSFYERYLGFRITMEMSGHPVDEAHIIPCNHPLEIQRMLSQMESLPQVFVCANDFIAADTLLVLRGLGKSVPEDVMLLGFDDSAESRICQPPLTTVHIHTQTTAFSALHLLISRIKEPSLDFRTVHTETDLIYRESTRIK